MCKEIIVALLWVSQVIALTPEELLDIAVPRKDLLEACGYESCPAVKSNYLNVHIVPSTHLELGYDGDFDSHYSGTKPLTFGKTAFNVKAILDAVITALWESSIRRFTWSDFPYFFRWWKDRDPTVRRMVYTLIRQGRLDFVGGGWGQSDEAATNYQGIIDHHTYTLRKINATFLECGRPLVAWQADALGHSKEFASLFAQMGYDGLFINPISFDDELARLQNGSLEFLWRGSDDLGLETDIFTHKLFDGYKSPPGFCFSSGCQDQLIITSNAAFNNYEQRIDEFLKAVEYRQAPYYKSKNVMVIMGHRLAYSDAGMWYGNIDKLINLANEMAVTKRKAIRVYYSSPYCYLKAVHDANPTLPIKQDDFFPYSFDKNTNYVGIYTSRPTFKFMVAEANIYLQMCKQLQVLAKLGSNSELFEEFNWILGVMQDHNVMSGGIIQDAVNIYTHKLYIAVQKSTLLLKQAFNKLRRSSRNIVYFRCDFNSSSCPNLNQYRSFLVVYNPLGWPVTMPIRVPVLAGRELVVYDPDGNEIEASLMKIPHLIRNIPGRDVYATEDIVFMADNLPPLGYRSYYLQLRPPVQIRFKRTIYKKMKKNQYYINERSDEVSKNKHVTNTSSEDSREIIDLDYTDDLSTTLRPKIIFGHVSAKSEEADKDVVTPKNIPDWDLSLFPYVDQPMVRKFYNPLSEIDEEYLYYDKGVAPKNNTDALDLDLYSLPNVTEFKPQKGQFWRPVSTTTATLTRTSNTKIPSTTISTSSSPSTIAPARTQATIITTKTVTMAPTRTTTASDLRKKYNKVNNKVGLSNHRPPAKKRIRNRMYRNTTTTTSTPKPLKSPTLRAEDDLDPKQEKAIEEMEEKIREYQYEESLDNFIQNKYVRVEIDPQTRTIRNMKLSNGVNITLNIQFYFYESDDPIRTGRTTIPQPGPSVFRALDNEPTPIKSEFATSVFKNFLVQEMHFTFSDYASFALRLYYNTAVLEVDWLVGPVPIKDGLGKDIFIRYSTDLESNGTFYTDANGRQTIKRIRNRRPTFEPKNMDPVGGNLYPVTSKIFIEDVKRNVRFSILNDRCQGGTSLNDGDIDLFLHRRITTVDTRSNAILNETEQYGTPIRVRGTHYLYLTKANYKPNKVFEKKLAKEIRLRPQIFAPSVTIKPSYNRTTWMNQINEYSGLNKRLPKGVHLLTLEQWNDGTLLIRFENYLEINDVVINRTKIVYPKNLFRNFNITSLRETTLAGNQWLTDWAPLQWKKEKKFYKNFNNAYGSVDEKVEYANEEGLKPIEYVDLDVGLKLEPQQIRTFVATYVWNSRGI